MTEKLNDMNKKEQVTQGEAAPAVAPEAERSERPQKRSRRPYGQRGTKTTEGAEKKAESGEKTGEKQPTAANKKAPKKPAQPKEKRLKTALEVIEMSKPKSIRRKPSSKSTLQRQKPAQNILEDRAAIHNIKNGFGRFGKSEKDKPSIKVYFLGGLNEIGKNFTLFECEDDMIIVDCGMAYRRPGMPYRSPR